MNSYTDQCVYCGGTEALTYDHVPPKCLFARPRPNNLITVRSCAKCNIGASDDDEYFRLMLSLELGTGEHDDVKKNLPAVLRSLGKPNKLPFARSILSTLRMVELKTPSGIYLGRELAYDVDLTRLDRVVARTIRGLFFREAQRRIPEDYSVVCYSESGLRDLPAEVIEELQRTIISPLRSRAPKTIGNLVFSYWVQFVEDDPNVSAWLLEFYQRIRFLGSTAPLK